MNKLKVVTVVGTRPEIIRLARLIPKLDAYTDHILVHTGQNYDPQLSDVFFRDLELRQPDYYLNVDTSSFGSVMGDTLKKSEEILLKEKPDAVMILGDTNSAVAAIVAERLHIPVYHMEAGNRSFDNKVPEELNRRLVDHISTFNLPYTELARQNLLREGLHPRQVFVTGSPMGEIREYFGNQIARSTILGSLSLRPREYLVVSLHRQENVDDPDALRSALKSLSNLSSFLNMRVVVTLHPRTRKNMGRLVDDGIPGLEFLAPLGYFDYVRLQIESYCVISDSGTIGEECSIFGFAAVTWRNASERPEAIESASLVRCSFPDGNLNLCVGFASQKRDTAPIPSDYLSTNFSDRVFNFLLSTCTGSAEK